MNTDWLDRDTTTDPLLSNPAILNMALSEEVLIDGNNSDPVNITNRQQVVLRVLEHEDPRAKTLEEVREQVTEEIRTEKAGKALDESLTLVKAAYGTDADFAALIEANGGELEEGLSVSRSSAEPDRTVVAALFKLARPAENKPVLDEQTLANGDRMLSILKEISVAEPAEGDEPVVDTAASSDPRLGNAEFTALLESLKDGADVEINEQAMNPAAPAL